MSEKDHSRRGHHPSRRAVVKSAAGLLSAPLIGKVAPANSQEKLKGSGSVIAYSYGGSATAGIRKNVFEPFTQETGITVVDVIADNSEPQLRAMHQAGRMDWDVTFVDPQNHPAMSQAGMFEPIDYSLWDAESLEGVPKSNRLKDAVVAFRSVTILAYDVRAFPNGGPKNWVDFWNVRDFPGRRGLAQNARHIGFALSANGEPPAERWPLTDDKFDRALRKLDEIRPNITKWWTAGGEPVQLLLNGELQITSCYDSRALNAIRQGAPIRIVWDGGNLVNTMWAVLKGGPNTANAQKLIAFVNRARHAAGFTLGTMLPAPNIHLLQYLPSDLAPLLNISKENASKVIEQDSEWLAVKRPDGKTNLEHMQERWLAWLTK